jgi:hypothetical protein
MKRNSLVVLGLSAVLGFGLFGIGCSDDSVPAKTDGSTDAKSDSAGPDGPKGSGGAIGTGGAIGNGGAIGTGGALDGGNTGGVTGTGGTPSTGGATGAGGSTALDGGSPDLKGIDVGNADAADAPANDLAPVVVDGGVDAPDTSITPVDTGIDIGAVDTQGIDGQGLDGGGID